MIKFFKLIVLQGLLDFVHLSSSPNKRFQFLDLSEKFTCNSYFQFLTHSLNTTSFLIDKPIWKSKAPSIVKSFIWTTMLNRINTNDIWQVRRLYKAVFPDVLHIVQIQNQLHICFCTVLWLTLCGILCLISLLNVEYVLQPQISFV